MNDKLICPVCGKHMRAITTQHIRTHGFKDACSFKEYFGLEYLRCSGIRRKQSSFMKEHSPTIGGHSEKSIQRIRETRKGKGIGIAGKYERTPEIRQKISEGITKKFKETPYLWKGQWVDSERAGKVWVRSSWEARVLKILDACPGIEGVTVEPFLIPYEYEGTIHFYIPDFLVVMEGNIKDIWEVKPKEFVNHPKNVAKWIALQKYAEEHYPLNIRIVTLKNIEKMEQSLNLVP